MTFRDVGDLEYVLKGWKPRVAIETGTFKGDTTRRLLRTFEEVHTVEAYEPYYEAARKSIPDAHCHSGNSAEVLPTITPPEPVFFYLDAHFFPQYPETVKSWPLLTELEFIANRKFRDIVVVDDVHAFGTKWWEGVTEKAVLDALGNRVDRHEIVADWMVVWCR